MKYSYEYYKACGYFIFKQKIKNRIKQKIKQVKNLKKLLKGSNFHCHFKQPKNGEDDLHSKQETLNYPNKLKLNLYFEF